MIFLLAYHRNLIQGARRASYENNLSFYFFYFLNKADISIIDLSDLL
jgi:hypothetical protein